MQMHVDTRVQVAYAKARKHAYVECAYPAHGCSGEQANGGGGDVVEGGEQGGLAGRQLLRGPPYGPRLKSSCHRRRRSKKLAVSLKHWKGWMGGGGGGLLLRCTAVLIHPWGQE